MMECKKALVEANGDLELAVKNLESSRLIKAAKKSSRVTAEGLVAMAITPDHQAGVLVEVNCETDFVARESKFKEFCVQLAQVALHAKTNDIAVLSQQSLHGKTIEDARLELVGQLGENLSLRRVHYMSMPGCTIGAYLHGGIDAARIGVLVALKTSNNQSLAKDLAMQVAAMGPIYITEGQAPQSMPVDHHAVAHNDEDDDESTNVTTVLYEQEFFKQPDLTVADVLANASSEVVDFLRYKVGEGIEKKQDDFVSEVMAQAGR
jgi:elongation factor Ts